MAERPGMILIPTPEFWTWVVMPSLCHLRRGHLTCKSPLVAQLLQCRQENGIAGKEERARGGVGEKVEVMARGERERGEERAGGGGCERSDGRRERGGEEQALTLKILESRCLIKAGLPLCINDRATSYNKPLLIQLY